MSRISETLRKLKKEGRAALIPYIMAGDPGMATTERLVFELERSGADMLELGVPFSDPLADGPTIQRAAVRALGNGVNIKVVLGLVRRVRKRSEMPVILMLYYNLVHSYGEARFAKDSAAAGVDGVIIPDLPPDEAGTLTAEAKREGLDVIFLLAPTSSPDRIRLVSSRSKGFIYYVSLTGVTGARVSLDKGIGRQVERIRRASKKPVCVGFGISKPSHARAVARMADGVIVGSAIVGIIEKSKGKAQAVKAVGEFVRGLRRAMGG